MGFFHGFSLENYSNNSKWIWVTAAKNTEDIFLSFIQCEYGSSEQL